MPTIPVPRGDISSISRWTKQATAILNEFMRLGPSFLWDEKCPLAIPTSTTIAGAAEIKFESRSAGNGTLIISTTGIGSDTNVALNGTDLGTLSTSPNQIGVTNLVVGINTFKIWSTSGTGGNLTRLEVWRNFVKELFDTVLTFNGGFEQGDVNWLKGTGWSIVRDPTSAETGDWVAKASGATINFLVNENKRPGKENYKVISTARVRKAAGAGTIRTSVQALDTDQNVISTQFSDSTDSSSWTSIASIVTLPATTAFYRKVMDVQGEDADSVFYVDNTTLDIVERNIDINVLETENAPKEADADNTTVRFDGSSTLLNPGFETGTLEGWSNGSGTVKQVADAFSGSWVLEVPVQASSNEHLSDKYSIASNERIKISVRGRAVNSPDAAAQVLVRFFDAAGNQTGSDKFSQGIFTSSKTTWTFSGNFNNTLFAPPGDAATYAVVFQVGSGTTGAYQFDNINVTIQPVDTDINATAGSNTQDSVGNTTKESELITPGFATGRNLDFDRGDVGWIGDGTIRTDNSVRAHSKPFYLLLDDASQKMSNEVIFKAAEGATIRFHARVRKLDMTAGKLQLGFEWLNTDRSINTTTLTDVLP